jgi:predicted RNA binding protein YcfA (HicA-like mRNA interferase family)
MRIYLRLGWAMAGLETNTRKITRRLKQEGWILVHGGKHDKYEHPDRPGVLITVPRHKQVSPKVARSIARDALWK